MEGLVEFVLVNKLELAEGLFAFLGLFSVIAKITPTEKDNAVLDFLLKIVHALGLTKK